MTSATDPYWVCKLPWRSKHLRLEGKTRIFTNQDDCAGYGVNITLIGEILSSSQTKSLGEMTGDCKLNANKIKGSDSLSSRRVHSIYKMSLEGSPPGWEKGYLEFYGVANLISSRAIWVSTEFIGKSNFPEFTRWDEIDSGGSSLLLRQFIAALSFSCGLNPQPIKCN